MQSLLSTTRRPDITFYPNGRIDVTARIVKMLGIQSGDVIDIAKDGEEYYLYVKKKAVEAHGNHETALYPAVKRSNNMRCYSQRLTNSIRELCNYPPGIILRFPAGETKEKEGKLVVPLITKLNITK